MQVALLKANLNRACTTHAELDYEGSCAIDSDLLNAAGICAYEQIEIYKVADSERCSTSAVSAETGSQGISVNGAAAHKARPGDRRIICAHARMPEGEASGHKPRLIYLNEHNQVTHMRNAIPAQAA